MRSRFGASCLASICRCMQDFYLSTTFFTLSLSLSLLSFIYLFIYAELVAFPVPDPNPAPKSLRGKFSPSDKAPALQISFLLNLFHLLSLPIQTEKKNTRFSFEYPTITMDPRSRACYNCAFFVLCLLCSPMTRTVSAGDRTLSSG